MRSLVTGGAGLIGSALVKKLVSMGHEVRVVDSLIRGKTSNLQPFIGREVEFWHKDLTEYEVCEAACKGMDQVFHLAASLGGVGFITKHPVEAGMPNFMMNMNTLKAAFLTRVPEFLFTSTACIYPVEKQLKPDVPALKESDDKPYNPESPYGWAKLATEKMIEAYEEQFGYKVGIVRMFNVYGPGEDLGEGTHVIPALIRKAIRYPKEDFIVWGDGTQTRSFIYVDDAVNGIIATMEKGKGLGPFNIGIENRVSIRELAEMVVKVSEKDIKIKYDTSKPTGVIGRAANTEKARRILKWEPKMSFEDGIRRTYKWAYQILKS